MGGFGWLRASRRQAEQRRVSTDGVGRQSNGETLVFGLPYSSGESVTQRAKLTSGSFLWRAKLVVATWASSSFLSLTFSYSRIWFSLFLQCSAAAARAVVYGGNVSGFVVLSKPAQRIIDWIQLISVQSEGFSPKLGNWAFRIEISVFEYLRNNLTKDAITMLFSRS
nr:hypothetical protein Itr_chr12CG22740 [Ipomoea trifida]